MPTIITAARLVTPVEWIESPIVVVEDGHITALRSRHAMRKFLQADFWIFRT